MVPFPPKGMWLDYSKAETINPFTDGIQKFTVIEAQKESSSYKKYPVSITYILSFEAELICTLWMCNFARKIKCMLTMLAENT